MEGHLNAITKLQNRFPQQLKATSKGYREELGNLKRMSDLTKGILSRKITIEYRGVKNGISAEYTSELHGPDSRKHTGVDPNSSLDLGRLSSGLAGISVAFFSAVKSLDAIVVQNNAQRKDNQNFYNAIRLSGLEAKAATNAAENIQGYGGSAFDALASANSISASLGALSRGDTSLIRHLGMYGIGGIMPGMSPAEVQNAIKRKLSGGTLNANEVNALFFQCGKNFHACMVK